MYTPVFYIALAIFLSGTLLGIGLGGYFYRNSFFKGFAGLECRNFGGRNLDFFPVAGLITFRSLRSAYFETFKTYNLHFIPAS